MTEHTPGAPGQQPEGSQPTAESAGTPVEHHQQPAAAQEPQPPAEQGTAGAAPWTVAYEPAAPEHGTAAGSQPATSAASPWSAGSQPAASEAPQEAAGAQSAAPGFPAQPAAEHGTAAASSWPAAHDPAAGSQPAGPEAPQEPAAGQGAAASPWSAGAQSAAPEQGTAATSPWSAAQAAQESAPDHATPPHGQPAINYPGGAYGSQQTQQFAWQSGGQQHTHTPNYGAYQSVPPVHTTPRKGRSGRLVAGAVVLTLLVGGLAGGVGGYLGYQGAKQNAPAAANSLDTTAPPTARTANSSPQGGYEQVASKLAPSVVDIQTRSGQRGGEGSGIIISDDGMILTNNHVIADAVNGGKITVNFSDGRSAQAKILGRDQNSDLAVIQAQGVNGLTKAELGRSSDLAVGQQVLAFGSPFSLPGTVTQGIVSALHRPVRAGGDNGDVATVLDAIQTDASINPGNSGGPLVDLQGRVIGINSAIYSPKQTGDGQAGSVGLGFAIPIDQARRIADTLRQGGTVQQAQLGVQLEDKTANSAPGAKVAAVTDGSPAAQAGIKVGDVITKLDDRRISEPDALIAAVRSHAPGDKVKITIGDNERTVDVTLVAAANK